MTVKIDGSNLFTFEKLEYVVCSGDREIYTYDLLTHELDVNEDQAADNADQTAAATNGDAASAEPVDSTETETNEEEAGPYESLAGTYTIQYQLEDSMKDLDALTTKIRAYTTEGYEMVYELEHKIVRVTSEVIKEKEVLRYAITDNITQTRYFLFNDLIGGTYKKALAE